jgi:hypothetical protein
MTTIVSHSYIGQHNSEDTLYMFQTKSVFGPYAYGPDQIRILINQNYINTLVTDIGQVILDSAKQTFGVKLVNTNYSKKKKFTKGDKPWFDIESKRARQNYRKMNQLNLKKECSAD